MILWFVANIFCTVHCRSARACSETRCRLTAEFSFSLLRWHNTVWLNILPKYSFWSYSLFQSLKNKKEKISKLLQYLLHSGITIYTWRIITLLCSFPIAHWNYTFPHPICYHLLPFRGWKIPRGVKTPIEHDSQLTVSGKDSFLKN